MKNRKILYKISTLLFVIYFVMLCLAFKSKAVNTTKAYITTNTEAAEKEELIEVSVNIQGNKTAAFTLYLYFDNTKLEYVSGPENTNVIDNRIIHVWYDETGKTGEKDGKIAKYVFKAKQDGIANFVIDGEFYSKEGQLLQMEFVQSQVQIGKQESKFLDEIKEEQGTSSEASNANLQVLRIDEAGILPEFNKNIYNYYLTVSNDVKDIEVLYVAENPNATVTISGDTTLKEGLNDIQIIVVSEDKTQTNIYTIEITKAQNLELANTNLEILAIENTLLNPSFENNITKYSAEISKEVNVLNLLAIPENENSKVEIQGKENLKQGNNHITVIVTAENGITKRKYEIDVYKRNEEEENLYKEEQNKNRNLLEHAYEIEKTSLEAEQREENGKQVAQNSNFMLWIVIVIGGIITIVITILEIKKRNMNRKV